MKTYAKLLAVGLVTIIPLSGCARSSDHMDTNHMTTNQMASEQKVPARMSPADMSAERQAVETTLQNYARQVTTKDLQAMSKYVLTDGEDFTIFEGKGTNIGWADYRDNHLAPELANKDLVFTKYEFTNFRTFVDGDLAAASFTIDAAYTYKGKAAAHKSHGTAILKKVDGQWKLAHMQS